MKIGLIIDVFSPSRGGGEGYCVNLARELVARGHEVHVFASRWEEEPPGTQCHRVRVRGFGKTLPMMAFAMASRKAVAKVDLDVAHAVGKTLGMNVFNPHGGIESKWLVQNFRSISSPLYRVWKKVCRYASPRHYFIRWLEKAQYSDPGVLRFVAISDMVARDIKATYGVPDGKVRVVYNGVDTDRFHPRNRERFRNSVRRQVGTPDSAPVILHVTNNFRLKGLGTLILALSRARRDSALKQAELWVLGRGRRRRYVRLARKQGVAGAVKFLGWREESEGCYAAADLCVHPTFYDACSLTVLEAMASGMPAVTTATNGAAGYIEQGVNGFVLEDAADHAALAAIIVEALKPEFLAGAGPAARKRAEEFTLARNTEELLKVYEEVAALAGR